MKIEKLTDEQIIKMQEVKEFWLNYIFSCKSQVNKEAASIGIKWLYKLTGRDKPVVIYIDSPMGCQYAVAYVKEFVKHFAKNAKGVFEKSSGEDQVWDQVGDQVGDQVRAQVGAQVWDQVGDQVRAQVGAQVGAQVRAQVWAQVGAQVGDQVGDQVWAQVRDQVGDQVGDQVRDQKLEYQSFSANGSIWDYGWISFYDFFQQIGVHNHKGFVEFKNLLLSGVYDMIQLNGFCIVSSLPIKIHRNDSGRLHNPKGPAIEFKDGYSQYFINGRAIPKEIYLKADTLTKKEFLAEKNSDYKGAWYEILGQLKIMNLLGAKEIDTKKIVHKNGDVETITLLKTKEVFEEIDNQPFAWVKMVCPSTGTQYLQGVEPHHKCALDAIASLSPFKKEEYSFDFRS